MKHQKNKMTILDIAERAGVSTATVSRTINENGFVSGDARERIEKIIKETGFIPTQRKRRNSGVSTEVLKHGKAILLWTESQETQTSSTGRDMQMGLTEGLRKLNADLNLDHTDSSRHIPRSLQKGDVDGVFIHGPAPTGEILKYLKKLPVIWLLQQGQFDWGDRVQPDHAHAGYLACQDLVEHGCRHVCCITPAVNNAADYSQSRARAFSQEAERMGVKLTKIVETATADSTTPTGMATQATEIAKLFAKLNPRPDGLFVSTALGPYLHVELSKLGIIPMQDFRMVAGDANICARFPLVPAPVTIRIFSKLIGEQAVEMLQMRIKKPEMPQLITLLKPQLEVPD